MALEQRGVPTVAVITNVYVQLARRTGATQGYPYINIAETPFPIPLVSPTELRARAEAMIATVVDGLTLPPAELERRLKGAQQTRPRSA
jgi:hypothetical protein